MSDLTDDFGIRKWAYLALRPQAFPLSTSAHQWQEPALHLVRAKEPTLCWTAGLPTAGWMRLPKQQHLVDDVSHVHHWLYQKYSQHFYCHLHVTSRRALLLPKRLSRSSLEVFHQPKHQLRQPITGNSKKLHKENRNENGNNLCDAEENWYRISNWTINPKFLVYLK